jgi:hypothetical protein
MHYKQDKENSCKWILISKRFKKKSQKLRSSWRWYFVQSWIAILQETIDVQF